MTWHTPLGDRALSTAERALFLGVLAYIKATEGEGESESGTMDETSFFESHEIMSLVGPFKNLPRYLQLVVLESVAHYLAEETAEPMQLTAVREGAVYFVYRVLASLHSMEAFYEPVAHVLKEMGMADEPPALDRRGDPYVQWLYSGEGADSGGEGAAGPAEDTEGDMALESREREIAEWISRRCMDMDEEETGHRHLHTGGGSEHDAIVISDEEIEEEEEERPLRGKGKRKAEEQAIIDDEEDDLLRQEVMRHERGEQGAAGGGGEDEGMGGAGKGGASSSSTFQSSLRPLRRAKLDEPLLSHDDPHVKRPDLWFVRDQETWEHVIDTIADRVLWDRDFQWKGTPLSVEEMHLLGVEPGYFPGDVML